MALNNAATIIPGRGTVFLGAPHSVPPTQTGFASLDPTAPLSFPGFECVGHTSRDNTVQMEKSGGDSTVKGSWWDPNLVASRDDVSWSFQVSSLQLDYLTLHTAWPNGRVTADGRYIVPSSAGDIERSVLVLMTSGTQRAGWYNPRVSLALGAAPQVTTDGFFEINLAGTPLSATEAITSAEIIEGDLISWYAPVPLVVPAPAVTSATPAAATAGSKLTINGLNLTGTTGVTVGGVAGTALTQVDQFRVTATMPAGTAGPAPIIVTTPGGVSAAFTYTRG